VLSRNIANTRPRDFYDIYILFALHGPKCDPIVLKTALNETTKKRGSISVLEQYESIIFSIRNNSVMQKFWSNYQKEFDYAKDISFDETCDMVLKIMTFIKSSPFFLK
jgi:hypothetical protein